MFPVVRSAIDWLTVTGRSDEERSHLRGCFDSLASRYRALGAKVRPTRFRGYESSSINGLVFGERPDSAILVAMGRVADELFFVEAPRMGNCTRLDVCCDLDLEKPDERLASKIAERFKDGYRVGQKTFRPVLTVNFDGGETVYFGKRTGRYLLRLYDRNAKTGDGELGKLWRAEVQFNGDAAAAALKLFHVKQFPYERVCWELCFDKFKWMNIMKVGDEGLSSRNLEFAVNARSPETTLQWLRSSVQPAIRRLIEEGLESEVKEALGAYVQFNLFD